MTRKLMHDRVHTLRERCAVFFDLLQACGDLGRTQTGVACEDALDQEVECQPSWYGQVERKRREAYAMSIAFCISASRFAETVVIEVVLAEAHHQFRMFTVGK